MAVAFLMMAAHGYSQSVHHAVFDSLHREIVLLDGTDSVAAIPLDKTFRAGLNHEKKKKHKTVRYRLARYDRPIDIQPIPVVVGNNNSLLCLRGVLQGDTTAFFSLMLNVENDIPVLEILVPQISVNEFSFEIKWFRADRRPTLLSLVKDTVFVSKKRKRNTDRISLYGNIYRVAFKNP